MRSGYLWPIVALTALTLLACLPGLGAWCTFSPDGFQYLDIARHLHETSSLPPHRLLPPPGFPAILAPLLAFGDLPLLPMRLLFSICWAATAALTYLLYRDEFGDRLALLAGLLVALNSVLLRLTSIPLSDSVFIAPLIAGLVLTAAWRRMPVPRWRSIVLGGLLAAGVCLIRSTGLILLPTMALALLSRRDLSIRRRLLMTGVFSLTATLPLAAWELRQSSYPGGPTYAQTWTAPRGAEHTDATGLTLQAQRFAKFGPLRIEAVKQAMLPEELLWRAFTPPLDRPTTWLVGGFFVVVACARALRYRNPVDLFVLLTLVMLSLWPWDEGVRLVAPLIPVFAGYPLWLGLLLWRRAGTRRWARAGLLVVVAAGLATYVAGMLQAQIRLPAVRAKSQTRLREMAELATWHEAQTPAGGRWIGVTPKGDMSKVLLLGAAYLCRRPVTTIDVTDPAEFDLRLDGRTRAFVLENLAAVIQQRWGYTPVTRLLGFVVFENRSSLDGRS